MNSKDHQGLQFICYNQHKENTILFIHGLFGSAETLLPVALHHKIKSLGNLYLVDYHKKGNTFQTADVTFAMVLNDVKEFIVDHKLTNVWIVAHSFGARIAMEIAATERDMIKGICILDNNPFESDPMMISFFLKNIEFITTLDLKRSKGLIQDNLMDYFNNNGPVMFYMNELRGEPGDYEWSFKTKGLDLLLENYKTSISPIPFQKPVCFIKRKDSQIFKKKAPETVSVYYPSIDLEKDIQYLDSGHFLFVEKLEETVDKISSFLMQYI
jgi:esterase